MIHNKADKREFYRYFSYGPGKGVAGDKIVRTIFYGGGIQKFPKDAFNLAVCNMFLYPAKIAHLELIDDEWVLYKDMPYIYTESSVYYIKGATKEQQDFVNSSWFIDQKSCLVLDIRFD